VNHVAALEQELEAALTAMEAGFHVRLIATFEPDLVCAPAGAPASEWLARNDPNFDQFPVKESGAAIGVLLRDRVPNGQTGETVRDAMEPLRDGIIVSADTPISHLIPMLSNSHYRLVLRGGRINGLVTQSDLLKLPVRMLLFGLITHLEMCLRTLVRRRAPDWLDRVRKERRRQICREHDTARAARLDPDALEFSNFGDLIDVLSTERDLCPQFTGEMNDLRKFRNAIAHAHTYIQSPADVNEFVSRFTNTQKWIGRASELARIPV
jgi:hypothetical protein